MNGLDLFSGIGGITKALEGYVIPVAYCENDRYAQAVLLSRMSTFDLPIAPIWDDVSTLRGDMVPPIDIIYGGFPCQDISCAGRGEGLDGERSGLFFEIVRLVSEIRPRFVFLENVAAITVRGAERVVGEFCRLGYDCRWGILSAADVGANHLRARWWLLAHSRHGGGRDFGPVERGKDAPQERSGDNCSPVGSSEQSEDVADAGLLRPKKCQVKTAGSIEHGQDVADAAILTEREQADQANAVAGGGDARAELGGGGWWSTEPNVGRVAHGIPQRVDRLRALGNSVVPAQAREAFERLMGL